MKTIRFLIAGLYLFSSINCAFALDLRDVSKDWTFRSQIVSAFPSAYSVIPKEENANVIRVIHYFQGDQNDIFNERRIEIFYTGGDWMEFGMTYFIANSPNPKFRVYPDESAAYFIGNLSTPDLEEGSIPPLFDPLDPAALQQYILEKFLDANGNVREEFEPLKPTH